MALPSTVMTNSSQVDYPTTAEGKRNFAWSAVHPDQEARPSAETLPESEGGFGALLDIVNPLQHIPIVGNIYRAATGDTISAAGHVLGGMLFGGPLGFLAGAATALFSEIFTPEEGGETAVADASEGSGKDPSFSSGLDLSQDGKTVSAPEPAGLGQAAAPTDVTDAGRPGITLSARREASAVASSVDLAGVHDGALLGAGYGVSREGRTQVAAYLEGSESAAQEIRARAFDAAAMNAALDAYAKTHAAPDHLSARPYSSVSTRG